MPEPGDSQTHPLVVDRTLFAYTPGLQVIALDAARGSLLWKFDAGVRGAAIAPGMSFTGPARGLAYWTQGTERRLFAGVMNYLYALDPATGQPIQGFGERGAIDLRKGLGGDYTRYYVALTSPGVIYKDLIIVGFRTSETAPAAPGDIRAYDVRSGELRWSFHTIPRGSEEGASTWPAEAWRESGGANSWAGMALDEKRGIVFVPTGSAVPDFYGAARVGDNLFANSLLALDAATGKRLWHFQFVHHDVWDRDLPSQPSLVTVQRNGKSLDAVVQTTKQGFLFLFDRSTGAPLFPIEERPTPASEVPGEVTARTQPYPLMPEPFARQRLTEDLLTRRTAEAHAWALDQFRTFRSDGQFVPLAVGAPTVVFPGFDGGSEWGGIAIDPRSAIAFVNSNDVAWTGSLMASVPGEGLGASLYQAQCSTCHGSDRKGSPPAFPSLVDVGERLNDEQIATVIRQGRGRMPAFPAIAPYSMPQLVNYVRQGRGAAKPSPAPDESHKREMGVALWDDLAPARYSFEGYHKFLDPDGYPAVAPPWGTLNAIDLNTGTYLWKIPLGEYPELAASGLKGTGSENYGGPIVTASGVLFIGATVYDRKFRAIDSKTGALLWETDLPHSGTATPVTYMVDGKQYVVIGTSSARDPKQSAGSAYVAFALP